MNSPRNELGAALRAVNRAWSECPEPRPNVFVNLADLEREVDAAVAIDDSDRARAAVETWREDALTVIAIRTAHAPLEARSGWSLPDHSGRAAPADEPQPVGEAISPAGNTYAKEPR